MDDNWIFHHQPTDGWFGAVVKDMQGNIIVGGGGGNSHFRVYNGDTWDLYMPEDFDVPFGFYGRSMAVDADNVLWLAQGNFDGLTSWDGTMVYNHNTSNSGLISNSVFGVGVDLGNQLWHTELQSFNGLDWATIPFSCNSGSRRRLFFPSSGEVWVSGGSSVHIEEGIVFQPCVYRIADNDLVAYHADSGDNLPDLSFGSGHHLMSEAPDGTILLFGRGSSGAIEAKALLDDAWVDWGLYEGPEVAESAYYSIWTEPDGTAWLCGQKGNGVGQIVQYCQGEWTVYDLPEDLGFPNAFFDIMVNGNTMWAVGSTGICELELPERSCLSPSAQQEQEEVPLCDRVYYTHPDIIFEHCKAGTLYGVYGLDGRLVAQGEAQQGQRITVPLSNGLYLLKTFEPISGGWNTHKLSVQR